ncbi:MAG: hypothetical protein U0X91_29430 [Spirosomataceae bacterium]
MKKNYFIACFLCLTQGLMAQTDNANSLIRDVNGNLGMGTYMTSTFDSRYEGFKGSPLFISEWIKGQMAFVDGKVFKEIPLKYNAYTKELLMKRPSGDSLIVFPYQVLSFTINDPVTKADFTFKRYPKAQTPKYDMRDVYFLVLYEGKTSLLKLVSKTLKKADFKDPYSNNVRYDTYEDDNSYYLLKADGSMVKVKRSKKSVLDALSDKEIAIKALLEQEKIEFKSERELVRVVAKYDVI